MTRIDITLVQNNLTLLLGVFVESGKVAAYVNLAVRLSVLAHRGNAWSWRYVQSVHKGTMKPSGKFAKAVELMVAEIDGLPAFISETKLITVYARPGSVSPNAIVIGESKPCSNPVCAIHFIPRVPWQKYCPRCRVKRLQGS